MRIVPRQKRRMAVVSDGKPTAPARPAVSSPCPRYHPRLPVSARKAPRSSKWDLDISVGLSPYLQTTQKSKQHRKHGNLCLDCSTERCKADAMHSHRPRSSRRSMEAAKSLCGQSKLDRRSQTARKRGVAIFQHRPLKCKGFAAMAQEAVTQADLVHEQSQA